MHGSVQLSADMSVHISVQVSIDISMVVLKIEGLELSSVIFFCSLLKFSFSFSFSFSFASLHGI